MKIAALLFTLLFISCIIPAKHPIENMSVGSMNYRNNGIHVKMRCLEDGLAASLTNFRRKPVSFDYDIPDFSPELVKTIQAYFQNHFQLTADKSRCALKLVSAGWVKGTQYSDHAFISIEFEFAAMDLSEVKSIQIKNSLLQIVPEQKNILHVELKGKKETLTFDKNTFVKQMTI